MKCLCAGEPQTSDRLTGAQSTIPGWYGKELEHMLQERLRQLSLSSLKRRLRVCGDVSLQPTAT